MPRFVAGRPLNSHIVHPGDKGPVPPGAPYAVRREGPVGRSTRLPGETMVGSPTNSKAEL